MSIHYEILDSENGDSLGAIDLGEEMPDEHVIQMLVNGGYLDPPADGYFIDDAYPFSAHGDRVITDDDGNPLLTLTQEEPEDFDEDESDDDDEDDDPDELNSEDVL